MMDGLQIHPSLAAVTDWDAAEVERLVVAAWGYATEARVPWGYAPILLRQQVPGRGRCESGVFYHARRIMCRVPIVDNWRSALVSIVAHEARHAYQQATGQPYSERDSNRIASAASAALTGAAWIAPWKAAAAHRRAVALERAVEVRARRDDPTRRRLVMVARLVAWTRRARRAATAIRKLNRRLAALDRKSATPAPVGGKKGE